MTSRSLWARKASSNWSPRLPTPMNPTPTRSLAPSTREYPAAVRVAAVAAAALANVRRVGEGMRGLRCAELRSLREQGDQDDQGDHILRPTRLISLYRNSGNPYSNGRQLGSLPRTAISAPPASPRPC